LRAGTLVDHVVIDNGRARGAQLLDGELVEGDTIVLAAGAYGSPTILLRSGVGPASDLRSLDIDVVADLAGVGANLIDHPALSVDVGVAPSPSGDWFQSAITWRSDHAGDDPYDMHLVPGGPINDVFFLFVAVMRPHSRGRVTLRSRDANASPRIQTGGLHAPEDLARMIQGVRHARELLHTSPLRELITGPELKVGLDASDDDELARAIERELSVYHHACGTCAMGVRPEDGAVVDSRGRVYGVEGLLVADAAIMPMIPAANTNLPVMMIGERIAATMTA
jgi:choline dehydrogenase